jgi:hypothetical protein
VRSASALAFAVRISPLVIGLTVVRFVSLLNRLVDRQWRPVCSTEDNDILLSEMTAFLDERLDQPQ